MNIKKMKQDYKLLVIPGHVVIDEDTAGSIRAFVENGGIAVMAGYSGSVDGNGHAHTTCHPGLLSDVFGIRVAGFSRTDEPWTFSHKADLYEDHGKKREVLKVLFKTEEKFGDIDILIDYYGNGYAYYVAAETEPDLLKLLLQKIGEIHSIRRKIALPEGIQDREIAPGQYFIVNTTSREIKVTIPGTGCVVVNMQNNSPFHQNKFCENCHL